MENCDLEGSPKASEARNGTDRFAQKTSQNRGRRRRYASLKNNLHERGWLTPTTTFNSKCFDMPPNYQPQINSGYFIMISTLLEFNPECLNILLKKYFKDLADVTMEVTSLEARLQAMARKINNPKKKRRKIARRHDLDSKGLNTIIKKNPPTTNLNHAISINNVKWLCQQVL